MNTLAAAVLIVGEEAFEECLMSLRQFDQVYVLTDNQAVLGSVRRMGAVAKMIATPSHIEAVGEELLSIVKSEWVLLVDPDERFLCSDYEVLRSALIVDSIDVAGYSIAYVYSFLETQLCHTYKHLRKTKLVRPRQVRWPTRIHGLPIAASSEGRFLSLPRSVAHIETELVCDVRSRLARHAYWSSIEASEAALNPVNSRHILHALVESLDEYFVRRSCDDDGNAGILNGLLHLIKRLDRLLFEAELAGIEEEQSDRAKLLGNHIREVANTLAVGLREFL
jgi:hypothetical protein